MLSLAHNPERLAKADNLMPVSKDRLRTRPGARQIVAGPVLFAKEWSGRIVYQDETDIRLWTATQDYHIAPKGSRLDATEFQALTVNAIREDRCYVADGENPLWYIHQDLDSIYKKKTFENEVLDASNNPYPVPVAFAVTTWRNRLWVTSGDNRVQHCDNNKPHAWDPLFTLEFQGAKRAIVRALAAFGDVLAVGTQAAVWTVSGTSQFNWNRNEAVTDRGAISPRGLASDSRRIYHAAETGIYLLGADKAVTEDDLELAFSVPDYNGQVLLSPDGRWLLIKQHDRLFVMNTRTQMFGEIIAEGINGVLTLNNQIGWYGEDGIWILETWGGPNVDINEKETPVTSVYELWPAHPNAGERASTIGARVLVKGQANGKATLSVSTPKKSGGMKTKSKTFDTAREAEPVLVAWDQVLYDWPLEPVAQVFRPRLAGESFIWSLASDSYLEVLAFDQNYHAGGGN